MAKQSQKGASSKRRGSTSHAVTRGSGKKRQRTAEVQRHEVNDSLLRVLTGEDEKEISAPESANNPSPSEEDLSDSGSVSDDDDDKGGAKKGESSGDDGASKHKRKLGWSNPLSEAHAKKINVTVLLERANLETVKQSGRSGGFVLLNCDDHRHILKKSNRDANDARPDITHQCLLALMDSPLNKAGRLKVYVRTAKNVLIEIHPQTRIPRTIRRFSGLMAELLEKFKVRGTSGSTPLLKVIRNPITSHLPVGTRKVVCTYNSENVVDMRDHAARMAELVCPKEGKAREEMSEEEIEEKGETVNVLYVVGAMAHGKIVEDWADEYICVSEYPLSAATVCSRLTYSYESLFGIM